jgi:hypothetical protein
VERRFWDIYLFLWLFTSDTSIRATYGEERSNAPFVVFSFWLGIKIGGKKSLSPAHILWPDRKNRKLEFSRQLSVIGKTEI